MQAMRKIYATLALALFAFSGTARGAGGYPDAYALRPLELPPGMVQLKVPVVMNLSRGAVANPVFIPFELRLGLTSEVEVRLFHPVHGLCVSGKSKGCDPVYNDLGLGMLYSALDEQGMELALLAALEVTSFASPALLRLDAGLAFKVVRAPFSIAAWPYFSFGLDHRDKNGDSVNIPIEFDFQLSPPTALFAETGLYGDLHDHGNSWSTPLGVGINYLLQNGIDIGAEFKLTDVGNGADGRLFLVYLALRN